MIVRADYARYNKTVGEVLILYIIEELINDV